MDNEVKACQAALAKALNKDVTKFLVKRRFYDALVERGVGGKVDTQTLYILCDVLERFASDLTKAHSEAIMKSLVEELRPVLVRMKGRLDALEERQ